MAGNNGSGKTSLLESIQFLSSGRSFRGNQINPIIQKDCSSCLVAGEVESKKFGVVKLGFQRNDDGSKLMRLNGETQNQASELARHLPTLMLGPDTVELLRGAPAERRSFLNWGVFHVEHSFTSLWKQATKALKQRNALLREDAKDNEIVPWTRSIVDYGERIDAMRDHYMERFLPAFTETYRFLLSL